MSLPMFTDYSKNGLKKPEDIEKVHKRLADIERENRGEVSCTAAGGCAQRN